MLIGELRREHTDAISRNMRNNVLIHGLEDSKRESQSDQHSKVESSMLNKLGFDQDTINMFIDRVH